MEDKRAKGGLCVCVCVCVCLCVCVCRKQAWLMLVANASGGAGKRYLEETGDVISAPTHVGHHSFVSTPALPTHLGGWWFVLTSSYLCVCVCW